MRSQESEVFTRIVVGCDGSPQGRDAVALGALVASATGATLSIIGVFSTAFVPIAGVSDRKTLRAETMRFLRRDRDLIAPDAFVHAIADVSAPRALRRYAEHAHADLLIIGSAPSAADGHVAIGRRGRQLLHDAPFALAIASRGLHDRTQRLSSVGVGYDGGREAEEALMLAADLARSADARLVVRQVVEHAVYPSTLEQPLPADFWLKRTEEERRMALAATQAAVAELGLEADVSATVGDPGEDLRGLSEAVDLIVVGSRRWGTIARLWTGGVGETLVSDARCPVIIVPRGARRRRAGGTRSEQPDRAAVTV
jgi:nucleotide-binding universal stress UspA family protein